MPAVKRHTPKTQNPKIHSFRKGLLADGRCDDADLSTTAADAVENPGNQVLAGVVSIWETATKAILEKNPKNKGLNDLLAGGLAENGFTILDLN